MLKADWHSRQKVDWKAAIPPLNCYPGTDIVKEVLDADEAGELIYENLALNKA